MINSIQTLRGISIVLVVLYHLSALTEATRELYYISWGKIGVDIFFIISGYIMALILERGDTPDVFVKKRLIRILPLYYTATVLVTLTNYRAQLFDGTSEVIVSLVKSLLLIPHASIANPEKIFPIFIPGWTITYEMWFYLVIALVLFSLRGGGNVKAIPLVLLAIYGVSTLGVPGDVGNFIGNSVLLSFGLGIYIRLLETKEMAPLSFALHVGMLFGVALLISGNEGRLIELGFPAFMIFSAVFLFVKSEVPVLGYIGKVSYSLYITHVFVINAVELVFRKAYGGYHYNLEVMLAVAFIASIVVASVSYAVFEKRIDRALRRRFI
jgi:exopolysaccharide production protein ExoZ